MAAPVSAPPASTQPSSIGSVRRILSALLLVAASAASGAIVNLNLYNTEPLQDETLTPLLGNSSSGDLIQLFLLGDNGLINGPDPITGIAGDDVLFGIMNNPTHVGAGTLAADNNSGLLLQANLSFDDSFVGSDVYVRYWNSSTIPTSTRYNQTAILTIPATPAFPGEYFLDFAPSGSGTYATTVEYTYGVNFAIPEPRVAGFLIWGLIGFYVRWSFQRWEQRTIRMADPVDFQTKDLS